MCKIFTKAMKDKWIFKQQDTNSYYLFDSEIGAHENELSNCPWCGVILK